MRQYILLQKGGRLLLLFHALQQFVRIGKGRARTSAHGIVDIQQFNKILHITIGILSQLFSSKRITKEQITVFLFEKVRRSTDSSSIASAAGAKQSILVSTSGVKVSSLAQAVIPVRNNTLI